MLSQLPWQDVWWISSLSASRLASAGEVLIQRGGGVVHVDHLAAAPPEEAPPPADVPVRLPVALPPVAEATLAADNAARRDWLAEAGRQQRDGAHGDYCRRADFQVSITDPDATVVRRKGGGSHWATTPTTSSTAGRPASSCARW